MAAGKLRPIVVDMPRLVGAIRSAAHAGATAHYTRLGHEQFDDNVLMRFFVQELTGEPGFPSVQQDWAAIVRERERRASAYLKAAIAKSAEGPGPFIAYCQHMESMRQADLFWTNDVFRRALAIDAKIEARLRFTMNTISAIKFGATVGVAAIPLFVGTEVALTAWGVSLAYSAGKTLIKDHYAAADSNVVAFDLGRDVGKAARDRGVDLAKDAAGARIEANAALLDQAEREIAVLTRRLGQDLRAKKAMQLTRRLGRAEAAENTAVKAITRDLGVEAAGKAFPVVFAGLDVVEAIDDMSKEWQH